MKQVWNRIVCMFSGHDWMDMRYKRLMILDDSWPPNYAGGSHQCSRCGKRGNFRETQS